MATLEELEQQVNDLTQQLTEAGSVINNMEADLMGAFSDITNSLNGIVDRLDVAAQLQAEATRIAGELQAQAIDALTTKMNDMLSANGVNLAQATMGVGNIVDYWKSVGWAELNKVKNFNQAIEKIEQKIDVELVQAKSEVVDKFRSML